MHFASQPPAIYIYRQWSHVTSLGMAACVLLKTLSTSDNEGPVPRRWVAGSGSGIDSNISFASIVVYSYWPRQLSWVDLLIPLSTSTVLSLGVILPVYHQRHAHLISRQLLKAYPSETRELAIVPCRSPGNNTLCIYMLEFMSGPSANVNTSKSCCCRRSSA